MKPYAMAGMLLVAFVCLLAASRATQDPMVTVRRAYGVPPNHEWRMIHAVPQSSLWLGILLRDSVTGNVTALKIEWPACTGQRAE